MGKTVHRDTLKPALGQTCSHRDALANVHIYEPQAHFLRPEDQLFYHQSISIPKVPTGEVLERQ